MIYNIVVFPLDGTFVAKNVLSQTVLGEGDASTAIGLALAALGDAGGCVQLSAGEFPLTGSIQLSSRQSLKGSGRATRLLAPDSDSEAVVRADRSDGVEVSDLSVVGGPGRAEIGVLFDSCGDSRVTSVFGKEFSKFGIQLRNHSFLCQVNHCSVSGCQQANYSFFDLGRNGRGGEYVPNIANGCVSYGGEVGFEAEGALVLNLIGCMVHQSKSHGFYIHHESNSVLLSGCRTFQVGGNAVDVLASHELNISSSIFCWTRGHGIHLRKVSWGVVNGCNVIDVGSRSRDDKCKDGINMGEGTEGVQVSGNTLFSWADQVPLAHGVFEDESCRNNAMRCNNLNYFTKENGFVAEGAGSVAEDNVEFAHPPYRGNTKKMYPDFTNEIIDEFIRLQ